MNPICASNYKRAIGFHVATSFYCMAPSDATVHLCQRLTLKVKGC